jgi:phosphatidylserine decarboxylase
VLAPDSEKQILPLLIFGAALTLAAAATHFAIGRIMTPTGARVIGGILGVPGLVLLLLGCFLVYFYRDPEREAATGLVSPADGIVMFVEEVDDLDIGRGYRVGVFMSPLDVHVNRVPAAARLERLEHTPGGYLPAFNKESERNERVTTIWKANGDDPEGPPQGVRIKVVQIAGAVARRIDPWVKPGVELEKAQRYGMIRLGSRVDTYFPAALRPVVQAGNRVKAAASTLAVRDAD